MVTPTMRDASCIPGNPPPTHAPSSTRAPTPRADVPPCTAFAPPPSAPSSAETTTTATSATHPPTTCYLFAGPRPAVASNPPAPSSVDLPTTPTPKPEPRPERKKTFLKDVPREQLETLHPITVGGLLLHGWTWVHVPPWDGAGEAAKGEGTEEAAGAAAGGAEVKKAE